MSDWPSPTVAQLQAEGVLLVEDGNHGEYRPRPDEFIKGGTAFIRAADLSDGQVRFEAAGGIDDVALARIRKGVGRPGDVLFSHKGTVGKLARVPPDAPSFVCSPQTTFWRVHDESRLRRDYLYAYMRSRPFIDQWWARKGETDMADYVSLTAQRQLRVAVPPLDVQRRIAAPLAAIDDLIENNRRRVEVLEEVARTTYREWFVRFRYPGHEIILLVDSPLGPIPNGWRLGCVDHLVTLSKTTVDPTGVEPSTPAVGLEHIPRRRLTLDDWGEAGELGSRKATCAAGDILFGKIRPYFHKVSVTPVDGICSTDAIVLRPHAENWGQAVLLIASDEFVAHAVQTSNGTKMPRADWKVIREFRVAVPPAELANRFSETTHGLLAMAQTLMFQARHLAILRDLLLPKLIAGSIDVSHLDLATLTEVASA
ncbi:MAG: restriction endonuclease subunit S [Actinomycetota bacterium]|nr:restriction endonuclease subunit S [Actinomycetota bacterium]